MTSDQINAIHSERLAMTYTVHNYCGAQIAQVKGAANAARILISCPDAWELRSPGYLWLDRKYLLEEAIPQTYDNVMAILMRPSDLDEMFA